MVASSSVPVVPPAHELLIAEPVGRDLARPECVLATVDGAVFVSDWRGGVTRIGRDGSQSTLLARSQALKPNGFALRADGRFLIAHLDEHEGGVYELAGDGSVRPFLLEVDGRPLEPTNFVLAEHDAVWITVSTRHVPRHSARRRDVADGYVVRVDARGARIVADGIAFTNECRVDSRRRWLYVNETYGARVSRFPIAADGDLGPRETFVEFESDVFPDGLTFDADGSLWITSVFSNRLLRVSAERTIETVLDDGDPAFVAEVVADVEQGAIAVPVAIDVPWHRFGNLSSAAFGGPPGDELYLGCLLDSHIYRATAAPRFPLRGLLPPHWTVQPESGSGWIPTPELASTET